MPAVAPADRIAARFTVVRLLHARGQCEAAKREALDALHRWAWHHEDAPEVTFTYLVGTLAVLDRCGRLRLARALLHAYGALLPAPGTAGDAFFQSYVCLKLGDREEIERHRRVCAFPRRRIGYEDLKTLVAAVSGN